MLLGGMAVLGAVAVYNSGGGGGAWSGAKVNPEQAVLVGSGGDGDDAHVVATSRHLLASSLYPTDAFTKSQQNGGAIALHVLGVLYTFISIAVVCDDFFVPALEVLVQKYDIDDDVAGATFMAAGGSAPELFTALIGVFIAKSNVGFGTIIGSAVFNVLFVIGACAFFSSSVLVLTWWPLARDCTFYTFDLCMLYVFFRDQKIELYEALLLLGLYFVYVGFMKFNAAAERFVKIKIMGQTDFTKKANALGRVEGDKGSEPVSSVREGFAAGNGDVLPAVDHISPLPMTRSLTKSLSRVSTPGSVKEMTESGRISQCGSSADGIDKGEKKGGAAEDDDDDDETAGIDLSWPEGTLSQVYFVIAAPIMYLLAYTIPNCKKDRHLFGVVFFESIFYIGFFSYFMVWWATSVGAVVGISDVVMGYTFLAAGTSVPDLMSSIIVARQGLGDMAVSSSIGSNIFDITFGLPVPWALWSLSHGLDAIIVESDSLNFSLVLLIVMLVSVVGIIALCGWRMTNGLGMAMLVLYGIFLTLVIMQSQGVIGGF